MALTHAFKDGTLRVFRRGHEVLVIHRDGKIVTRGVTRSGRLHIQTQSYPPLTPWLARPKGTTHREFSVSIQTIPPPYAAEFDVPMLFAIFVWEEFTHPVLITCEPLAPRKLRRLRQLLPPITAVINAGRLHVPRGSEKLARGLRAKPSAPP
jgi:hypothetical protein